MLDIPEAESLWGWHKNDDKEDPKAKKDETKDEESDDDEFDKEAFEKLEPNRKPKVVPSKESEPKY